MVSARRFRQVFIDQWNHDLGHNMPALLDADLGCSARWTDYMLRGEDAFLRRIANEFNLSMETGWFNLDAIYYHAIPDLLPDWRKPYPGRLEVYIEHENGGYPEEEMYKLLMWPASLKVLIFYDWAAFQQEDNPYRQRWLLNKLTMMFKMGREVDVYRPGVSKAEYLFLIGQTIHQGESPEWRYLYTQDGCWPEQPDALQPL